MGCFSQKGLCYNFEILQGLQSNKNMKIPMGKKFRGPPYPPKKADFGCLKAKIGRFSQKGLYYSFEILQGLLSNKNVKIPMRENNFGYPPAP